MRSISPTFSGLLATVTDGLAGRPYLSVKYRCEIGLEGHGGGFEISDLIEEMKAGGGRVLAKDAKGAKWRPMRSISPVFSGSLATGTDGLAGRTYLQFAGILELGN